MNCKKGELSEKDIKKENADLSVNELSDVSGGKMFLEGSAGGNDGDYLSQKDKDDVLLNPKGEDGRLLNPKGEDGVFLSPEGKSDDSLS